MSNVKLRPESGLNDEDTYNIRVFMRSINDAVRCSQEIAQKDTSTDQYKQYLRILLASQKNLDVG